ncbi:MAG: CBS domain-containing protein [Smithellaceae bacterium]|nr:CBS domain-containing protein [Smithellaceae bacterium]
MFTLKTFLAAKKKKVWTVSPDTSLYDALRMMDEKNIGAAPVIERGKLIGIFSERDFARKATAVQQLSMRLPVKNFMTKKVRRVTSRHTMEDCMAMMTTHRVRHLPILEKNKIIGIITIGDVVKHTIQEQKFVLRKVLDSIEEGKNTLRMNVRYNVEQNILPLVKMLARRYPGDASFRLLEEHLDQISSAYYRKLVTSKYNFTSTEISVIKLLKAHYREKEIAETLNISISTVKKHKYAIRGKLGMRNKSGNITTHLDLIA